MKNRHEARQEAAKILFSREFHSAGDIQYAEREILDQDVVSTEEGDIILENDLTAYCDYLATRRQNTAMKSIVLSNLFPRTGTSIT